jgi:phosphoesterase RecJ-like protein
MTPMSKYKEIIELINSEKELVLATHILPDGDAIGSLLGLGLMLRGAGKTVIATWGGRVEMPAQYAFLAGQEMLAASEDLPREPGLIIALDCGSRERLGAVERNYKRAQKSVNIDHHRNNTAFGSVNVIEAGYASTTMMVLELGHALGTEISLDVAENLYTGLVTDTGRFQYSNTNGAAFQAAAELTGYGVDPARIFRHVYENTSYERLRLAGVVLAKTVFDRETGFIFTAITKEDFAATGASVEDTENLIDSLRAVAGVRVAAVFKETEGGLRVSLRSTGAVDVGLIAGEQGSGGHRLAAGYNGRGGIEESLADLKLKLAALAGA